MDTVSSTWTGVKALQMTAPLAAQMGLQDVGLPDQENLQLRMALERIAGCRNRNAGTEVPAHCINRDAI